MAKLPMRVQEIIVQELRAIGSVVENGETEDAMKRLSGLSDYIRRAAETAPMPVTTFHSLRAHERLAARRRGELAV